MASFPFTTPTPCWASSRKTTPFRFPLFAAGKLKSSGSIRFPTSRLVPGGPSLLSSNYSLPCGTATYIDIDDPHSSGTALTLKELCRGSLPDHILQKLESVKESLEDILKANQEE